jgi:PhnB protein
MTLRCTPFLLFDGNCAEAMSFYHRCIGGELRLTKLGDSPVRDQLPPELHDRIINAHLTCGPFELSATDWMASPDLDPLPGNTFAVFVTGDQMEEFQQVFDRLAGGAEPRRFQDLHQLPIGTYGQFYDRFGVQWIFLKP